MTASTVALTVLYKVNSKVFGLVVLSKRHACPAYRTEAVNLLTTCTVPHSPFCSAVLQHSQPLRVTAAFLNNASCNTPITLSLLLEKR